MRRHDVLPALLLVRSIYLRVNLCVGWRQGRQDTSTAANRSRRARTLQPARRHRQLLREHGGLPRAGELRPAGGHDAVAVDVGGPADGRDRAGVAGGTEENEAAEADLEA